MVYHTQQQFFEQVLWPAIDAEGGVTEMLCLGDVTDRRKYINFQTAEFAKRVFFEPARQRNIRIHWVIGNHDMPFKHSMALTSHETFKEYDVAVYRAATVVDFDGVPTLLVPWLCDETRDACMQAVAEFPGSVVAGHFEFTGFEMSRGTTNFHGAPTEPFAAFPLVLSGHYHHRSRQQNIVYLGAPYELTWADHESAHGFHWWTPTTHTLDFVENPHHLFHKFVYDDANQPATYVQLLLARMREFDLSQKLVKVVVRSKTQPLWYDTFASAVMRMGAHDVVFVDDTAWASDEVPTFDASQDVSLDTVSLIHRHLAGLPWANTDVQRAVTKVMTSLYRDALDESKARS